MPEAYTQAQSPLRFKAQDLGDDDLLITRLSGAEALSELFRFELELLAPVDKPVAFADVLGKAAAVALDVPGGDGPRLFQGIVARFAQGPRDDRFITYRATLVPQVWLLTKRVRSRTFQHVSVPDILKKVFDGLPVAYQIQGTFHPRDYCVQYRESDFAFASRLMEEEGIFYYFRQTDAGDEMVVANTPQGHAKMPAPDTVIYDEIAGGAGDESEGRVTGWQKVQEVRPGQVTLWDHHFGLPPGDHLEAGQKIQEAVAIGSVTHKLSLPVAAGLEVYDYPGGYAGRFDDIDAGGSEHPDELQKIYDDNRRVARLRIQEEAAAAVSVEGSGSCRQMTAGHKFTLKHFDADGDYVLTRVEHRAGLPGGGYRTEPSPSGLGYENAFRCLPADLPFRPPRVTPKPTVKGTQTAVVVGKEGEEIFTDKYGRVKVQFHWDREGTYNADSSCWIRVATIWAGQGWGVIHIPRIGQEVVVDFLEGDPDQPIVIGSVYNMDQMPPGNLPKDGMVSGLQSRSTPKAGPSNFNGMRANDTKGKESLDVQAEYDRNTLVKHNDTETVINDRTITVNGKHTETIKNDTKISITEGGYEHDVKVGYSHVHVGGHANEKYDGWLTTEVGHHIIATAEKGPIIIEAQANKMSLTAKAEVAVVSDTAEVFVQAATKITLLTGDSSIVMEKNGTITIKGKDIIIDGSSSVTTHGDMVRSNADTSHEIGSDGNCKSVAAANNVVKGAMVMLNPG